MATSSVDIVNRALRKVDNSVVQSLTENTETGLSVRDVYDESRQYVLNCAAWTFAIKRSVLARFTAAPVFGYSYMYGLPSDMIRPVDLFSDSAETVRLRDFRKESQGIACDATAVYCRYVFDLEDANKMTPLFRAALEDHLAYRFALDLPGSRSLAGDHLERFERVSLPRAYSNDAMNDGDYHQPETSWITERWA